MSIKEGYLIKQGGRIKTWKRRFFSLRENKLSYSKAPGLLPKGEIVISEADSISLAQECRRQPAFRIDSLRRGKKRVFYICAESQDVANSWVETLKRVANGHRLDHYVNDLAGVDTLKTLVEKPNGGKIEVVQKKGTNQQFCLKRYRRSLFKGKANDVIEEKYKFQRIHNPYVVPLFYLPQDSKEIGFVYEYATHGCLFGHLWDHGKFSEEQVVLYAAELADGIAFMHDKGVIYGDICPSTVLLMSDGHIRIPDTGIMSAEKPLSAYTAPELLSGNPATVASDWYSYGVLVYEMLTGMPPFYAETAEEMRDSITKGVIFFPQHVSEKARDFVRRLMKTNPTERLGMVDGVEQLDDIRNHQFFDNLSWVKVTEKSTEPVYVPGETSGKYDTVTFDAFVV